jgi:uncharacterized protein
MRTQLPRVMALLLSLLVGAVHATDWPSEPFVYAIGEAERNVPPDNSTITFTVSAFAERPEDAVKVVFDRAAEVARIFLEAGVSRDDIDAHQISKSIVRKRDDDIESNYLGYDVNQEFTIRLRDLTKYGGVLDQLLSTSNVSWIHAQFDTTHRNEIEAEMVAAASADAKRRAESMARGMGASLEKVFAASESPLESAGAQFGLGADYDARRLPQAAYARPRDTIFVPTSLRIGKRVYAIFFIKPGK